MTAMTNFFDEGEEKPKEKSDFEKLLDKVCDEKKLIDVSMKQLSDKFKNVSEVGNSFWEYYNYRLYLTGIKDTYKKQLNAYAKTRKSYSDDMLKSFKTGRIVGNFKGDVSILPTNDKERDIMYNEALSDIDYEIGFVSTHLEFIMDKISLIDKMIFGFETFLKYKDKYS